MLGRNELLIVLTAALPIAELRGAIPLGFYLKEDILKVFILAVIGNTLPVIPLLIFLVPVSEKLRRFKLLRKFFDWFFAHAKKKGKIIEKYEAIGLAIFVGIPLPATGAWTGCVAASLLKMRFRNAFWAIFAGILMAATIVTVLSQVGILAWDHIK